VAGCHTTLKFDGYKSELLPLSKGLNQGCPLSGIVFQFYNSDLVDVGELNKGKDVVMLMDDTLLSVCGKTLIEMNNWVKNMMTRDGSRLDWSCMHQCKFAIDKFGVMGLTRRREPNPSGSLKTRPIQRRPIFLQGVKVLAIATQKFLGVMLDQELRWKEHCQYVLQKGVKWVTQYWRLTKYMRWFFISVAIPRMMYAADLFLVPGLGISKGTKGFISKLAKIQRQAKLHIIGVLRSAPTDAIDACTDVLAFHLLVENLKYRAATRLVNLPQSHPLEKHIVREVNRYVKLH